MGGWWLICTPSDFQPKMFNALPVRKKSVNATYRSADFQYFQCHYTDNTLPPQDAVYKSTGVLTYTCYAMTQSGKLEDSVEIHVRTSEIKPAPLVALR